MTSWKPFLIRLTIFFILLYTVIPAAIVKLGTKPQISINVLYVPVALAGILGAFILLKKEELKTFNYSFSWKQAFVFGLLAYSFFAAYVVQQRMYWGYEHSLSYLLTGWTFYAIGALFLFLAVFNTKFAKTYQKPILISLVVITAYSGTAVLLNLAGYPLARLLAKPLIALLSLSNTVTSSINVAPTISAGNFSAVVGPPCTGITSLILFTGLFLFVLFLDWKKIDKKAAIWIYLVGIIGMLIVAFLRLYALFYIGANWSPKFALAGFHTNAGWLLFVVYFLVYFWFMYPKMLEKTSRKL